MASITDIVKDTAGDVRNTLFFRTAKKTPPDALVELIDHKTAAIGKRVWRGTLAVMASGFGKGLLFTGALLLISAVAWAGLVAQANGIPVGNGIVAGIDNALSFSTHAAGLLTLAVGGTLGAVAETRKSYNHLTAETARAQAQNYALARSLGVQPAVTVSQIPPEAGEFADKNFAPEIPECSHCARELEKRARDAQQLIGGRA